MGAWEQSAIAVSPGLVRLLRIQEVLQFMKDEPSFTIPPSWRLGVLSAAGVRTSSDAASGSPDVGGGAARTRPRVIPTGIREGSLGKNGSRKDAKTQRGLVCGKFWQSEELEKWIKEIHAGRIPDFGRSLRW